MRRVSTVLLDKDGTLLDFQASWGPTTVDVFRELAGDRADLVARLASLARIDLATARFAPDSPVIAGSTGDYGPGWAAALGRTADAAFLAEIDALYRVIGRLHLTAIPGAAAAVRRIAATGLPLGLATNDAEASARGQLEALGLADAFGFVAGYDSGYGAKPGPGMVLAFADWADAPAAGVALIGDSAHDMLAARAAGAVAVAVTTGVATAEELKPLADVVAPDLDAALDALGI